MTRYWVGTSGWHYLHWRDGFYPHGLASRSWLTYYFGRFITVEINATFYRLPRLSTWQSWRDQAPRGCRYAVKASRLITHVKRLRDCEAAVQSFLEGASLLGDRLGPILYQMPPSFRSTEPAMEALQGFLSMLPPRFDHVFEFRDPSWFRDQTYELLSAHGASFCSYDMPGIRCPLRRTGEVAYVRFHGRTLLYGSRYGDEELADWARRIVELESDSGPRDVYVYFNNDAYGYAVDNATVMAKLLGARALASLAPSSGSTLPA